MIKEFFGFDPFAENLRSLSNLASNCYPKYNLIKNGDGSWALEIAVAGFSKDNLLVEERNNTLIIEGKSKEATKQYLHKGISTKPFKLMFPISINWQLKRASLFDGILTFTFVDRDVKENKTVEIITDAS